MCQKYGKKYEKIVERNVREIGKKYERHESEREIPVDIESRSRVKSELLLAASCCCVPDYCRPD